MKWLAICVCEVIRLTRALCYQRVFRAGRMEPNKRVAGRAIVVCAMHRLWHILTYELHSHAHGEGVVCVHWVVFANRHEVAGLLFFVQMMVVFVYTFINNPNISVVRLSSTAHVHIYHTRVGVLNTRHCFTFRWASCVLYDEWLITCEFMIRRIRIHP